MPSDIGKTIEVGERLYKVGNPDLIWSVRRVFYPNDHAVPHAVIVREGATEDRNVISISTLLDTATFRRDRRNPQSVNMEEHHRRRTDFLR